MIEVGLDRAAAAHTRGARHDQRVADDVGCNSVGLQAGGGRGKPVALLHLQLGEAFHARRALGEGRDHREHGILVDHAGGARGRHRHALQAREAHADDRRRARRSPRAR